ncbi:MAG: di-heme oxidoredictase family protein [Vicinamibacterales bacterium]
MSFIGVVLSLVQLRVYTQAIPPAPRDPGVRSGTAAAGAPLPGLTARQREYFQLGAEDFAEVESVADGIGPRANLDSCGGCHLQPALGGSSPALNPQVAFAQQGRDRVPSFITLNGPVREARFIRNPDGTPDGGVHALFTVAGRADATGCRMAQPDFEAQVVARNITFRIPTPVFGTGLMELIPDAAILAGRASGAATKQSLGIRGRANFSLAGRTISGQSNTNGNDGTIARFGWKAQNKSLLIFSGEAYNVEMGITNDLFPTERDESAGCQFAGMPNSITDLEAPSAGDAMSSIEKFSVFMRFLAPPTPSTTTPGGATSIARGRAAFATTGCALCHTPSFTTGPGRVPALAQKPVPLYSDLLVHDMGAGLADGITQGTAGPREFRTAPLWGLGQRIFFLHDGRTNDLMEAIRAHASDGSEANAVVRLFTGLDNGLKQDLLNFLRSL